MADAAVGQGVVLRGGSCGGDDGGVKGRPVCARAGPTWGNANVM